MRVLLVSNLYPPYQVGGFEQLAAWVAEGLRGRGHETWVLTGHGAALPASRELHPDLDLDLELLAARHLEGGLPPAAGLAAGLRRYVFNPTNFWACLRQIRALRPDLVSFWNLSWISPSPLLAARARGVPAVMHLSDTVANPFRNPHPPSFPKSWRGAATVAVDALLRWGRPRRLIVPSQFLRRKLLRTEGLPPDRTEVLRWPVGPGLGVRAGQSRPASSPRRFLFVGALIEEKGVAVLVEAFLRALAEEPDLSLTLVGEGPEALVAQLKHRCEGRPVSFEGRLDRAGVAEAYATHDALVFPSVWDEPFALVPLEGQAMGLPVIATSAGGTPEAVEHESDGLLVPPADPAALAAAMLRLHRDPALAVRLAERGERRARDESGFEPFLVRLEERYRRAADLPSEGGARGGGP
jgi:glycogen(starch) synthase